MWLQSLHDLLRNLWRLDRKSLLPPRFKLWVTRLQDRHANHYTPAAYTTQQRCSAERSTASNTVVSYLVFTIGAEIVTTNE